MPDLVKPENTSIGTGRYTTFRFFSSFFFPFFLHLFFCTTHSGEKRRHPYVLLTVNGKPDHRPQPFSLRNLNFNYSRISLRFKIVENLTFSSRGAFSEFCWEPEVIPICSSFFTLFWFNIRKSDIICCPDE